MNDNVIHTDSSDEAKANRNLAIWVGVLGLGGFALCYVLFFALMVLRPGLIFKMMPIPAITEAALSDGKTTYLLSQKIDLSTVDPGEERPPETRHFLTSLNGTEQEIPAYAQASGAPGCLLFLNPGSYRIYDGSRWIEEHSAVIGNDPRGILAPAGLYVLSISETGPQLSLIAADQTVSSLPLPPEYHDWQAQEPCTHAKLVLYQGRLCLFWTEKDALSWTILDGATWSAAATSPHSGNYEVIADDQRLYLFQREGNGQERKLSYSVFANNQWSDLMRLPIEGEFLNWEVFIEQGKPKLFIQQFLTQTLYTIDQEQLIDPIRLKGMFDLSRMFRQVAVLTIIGNLLTILMVFGVSAGINRFKKQIWRELDAEYEFASLFRRFVALMLDNLLLLIPPALIIALAMPGIEELQTNPLRFILTIFLALGLYVLGGFLYHSLLEGLYGQTLGKKLCNIRVLKSDFTPCTLSAGFLRNLLRIADAFFYNLVALIAIAANFKWQRVGDMVANTVVVRVRKVE